MIDRKYLESQPNWQCTFKHTSKDARDKYICLMRTVVKSFYWVVPNYKGLFSWGATRSFTAKYTQELIDKGNIVLVSGQLPECLKEKVS